ncbi:M28 family metallopeptidase [Nocardioides silvaticus]|nr:M28 family peptidase [Nocardioides silvaticus]
MSDLEGVNLLATPPGHPGHQAGDVLLMAHLDTVRCSTGADDNASGVAVTLEVARQLRGRDHRVVIALVDLEELWHLGSRELARTVPPPGLVVCLDAVGFFDERRAAQPDARRGRDGLLERVRGQQQACTGAASSRSHPRPETDEPARRPGSPDRTVAERISVAMQLVQGCERRLQSHIDVAQGLRIDEDEIELARHGASDPRHAAMIAYGQQVVDLVGLVVLSVLTGAFNLVAGVQPDPGHVA